MKPSRTLLAAILVPVFLAARPAGAAAQPSDALGIRITGNINAAIDYPGAGAELSYQHFFGPGTRIEIDLGARIHDYLPGQRKVHPDAMLATSFQWRWPMGRRAGFYAGPAVQFGRPDYGLGVGAQAGFDWYSDGPLQLSIDVRPTCNWFLYEHFDACLGVGLRYTF